MKTAAHESALAYLDRLRPPPIENARAPKPKWTAAGPPHDLGVWGHSLPAGHTPQQHAAYGELTSVLGQGADYVQPHAQGGGIHAVFHRVPARRAREAEAWAAAGTHPVEVHPTPDGGRGPGHTLHVTLRPALWPTGGLSDPVSKNAFEASADAYTRSGRADTYKTRRPFEDAAAHHRAAATAHGVAADKAEEDGRAEDALYHRTYEAMHGREVRVNEERANRLLPLPRPPEAPAGNARRRVDNTNPEIEEFGGHPLLQKARKASRRAHDASLRGVYRAVDPTGSHYGTSSHARDVSSALSSLSTGRHLSGEDVTELMGQHADAADAHDKFLAKAEPTHKRFADQKYEWVSAGVSTGELGAAVEAHRAARDAHLEALRHLGKVAPVSPGGRGPDLPPHLKSLPNFSHVIPTDHQVRAHSEAANVLGRHAAHSSAVAPDGSVEFNFGAVSGDDLERLSRWARPRGHEVTVRTPTYTGVRVHKDPETSLRQLAGNARRVTKAPPLPADPAGMIETIRRANRDYTISGSAAHAGNARTWSSHGYWDLAAHSHEQAAQALDAVDRRRLNREHRAEYAGELTRAAALHRQAAQVFRLMGGKTDARGLQESPHPMSRAAHALSQKARGMDQGIGGVGWSGTSGQERRDAHLEAARAHDVASDDAQDQGDRARELHHRLHAEWHRQLAEGGGGWSPGRNRLTGNAARPTTNVDPDEVRRLLGAHHEAIRAHDEAFERSRGGVLGGYLVSAWQARHGGDWRRAAELYDRHAEMHDSTASAGRDVSGARVHLYSDRARAAMADAAAAARTAAHEARVADPTPHLTHGVSAAAHERSDRARHEERFVEKSFGYGGNQLNPHTHAAVYGRSLAAAADYHGEAATHHAVAADHAADAGDAARELHHRYHEAVHKARQAELYDRATKLGYTPPTGNMAWSQKARDAAAEARRRKADRAALLEGATGRARRITLSLTDRRQQPASSYNAAASFLEGRYDDAAEHHEEASQFHEAWADRLGSRPGAAAERKRHLAAAQAHRAAAAENRVLSRRTRRDYPMGTAAHKESDAARTGEWVARNDIGHGRVGAVEGLNGAADRYGQAATAHAIARDEAMERGDDAGVFHHTFHQAKMEHERDSLRAQAKSIGESQALYARRQQEGTQ